MACSNVLARWLINTLSTGDISNLGAYRWHVHTCGQMPTLYCIPVQAPASHRGPRSLSTRTADASRTQRERLERHSNSLPWTGHHHTGQVRAAYSSHLGTGCTITR